MCCPVTPHSRGTFGEALAVIAALAGYVVPASLGKAPGLVSYAILLGVIALFYFLLLLARMLYFWMTGGEQGYGRIGPQCPYGGCFEEECGGEECCGNDCECCGEAEEQQ